MNGLTRYQSPLDRVFNSFFVPASASAVESFGNISLDVVETPDAYIVKAEVPGVSKDQIEVNVEERNVTIKTEYRDEAESNGKPLWRERTFGKAVRSIRLPEAVDANNAQAKHVDGVLQLTLPKIAKANARQITIQ